MLDDGRSVLVAAPTGAGKTIVAEFAVHLALATPRSKVFYTTPMKALSNQKFSELAEEHGADQVGLLTGDSNINSSARIVVMTTEVLRNMLYADSALLRRTGIRRDGRGALPGRPVPRRGLGGGHHPPPVQRAAGVAQRDGLERRGVRRLAAGGARRHRGDRLGGAAGAARAARAGAVQAARPVRQCVARERDRGRRPPGQSRAGAAGRDAGARAVDLPRTRSRADARRSAAGSTAATG